VCVLCPLRCHGLSLSCCITHPRLLLPTAAGVAWTPTSDLSCYCLCCLLTLPPHHTHNPPTHPPTPHPTPPPPQATSTAVGYLLLLINKVALYTGGPLLHESHYQGSTSTLWSPGAFLDRSPASPGGVLPLHVMHASPSGAPAASSSGSGAGGSSAAAAAAGGGDAGGAR
jgi:hypothetical protein